MTLQHTNTEPKWLHLGACRGLDSRVFYPEDEAGSVQAKSICLSCSVQPACLEHALEIREKAEFTQIDPHRGNLIHPHLLSGSEDRAIATEHDCHVCLDVGQIFAEGEIFNYDIGMLLDDRSQPLHLFGNVISVTGSQENYGGSIFFEPRDGRIG